MYKNVCHKIIVYVLVGCLSFGVPATTYYKSVHAFEWVGGALAFEEALKWLLAIVGVTAAGSVASQVDWSDVRDQCVEVQLQQGATQAQVSEWWAKLARGTLDKASVCWDAFLDWSDSLVDTGSSGGGVIVPPVGSSLADCITYMRGVTGMNIDNNPPSYFNDPILAIAYGSSAVAFFYKLDTYNITLNGSIGVVRGSSRYYQVYTSGFPDWRDYSGSGAGTNGWQFGNYGNFISSNFTDSSGLGLTTFPFGVATPSSDWQSAIEVAKQNLELLNRDLPDENASEVAIPMPGLSDSDNEASADAYDNIIDAINDGTITLDDGIAQIQDLLHVLVIDDTTDIVQPVRPDPDTGEPEKKDDVIKENKSNMGFTLAGLEKVFPFCIPFDIYAFITLLVAEPVAPEFDFPIKSVNNKTEEIHIDLSPFEPVAVVVRYIFDFLFIIGLALMTRSLIGGGSSD